MKRIVIFVAMLFVNVLPVYSAEYIVDKAESVIGFSGTHAGQAFKGKFEKWEAIISFDAANLTESVIKVNIDTASAKTGNAMYDGTLPTADWFDIKNHPQASFVSESVTQKTDGTFTAKGSLTIRGKAVPVTFDFALSDTAVPPVKTTFTLTLDRLAHDIGLKSDAKAEWVSKEITLNISIMANPK